jgi:hypothetical protein
MDQPITDDTIEIEAPSFEEAIAAACSRLGLTPRDLAIDLVDPGSSESSSLGFRPVKVKVRRRDPEPVRRASAVPRKAPWRGPTGACPTARNLATSARLRLRSTPP